VLFIGKLHEHF